MGKKKNEIYGLKIENKMAAVQIKTERGEKSVSFNQFSSRQKV